MKTSYQVIGDRIVNRNIKNEQLLEQQNNRTLNKKCFLEKKKRCKNPSENFKTKYKQA